MLLEFFLGNLVVVNFIYGLSLAIVGAAIFFQTRLKSDYALSKILWIFGVFSLLHALHHFVAIWIMLYRTNPPAEFIRFFTMLISFLFFFGFARELLRIVRPKLIILSTVQFYLYIIILATFAFLTTSLPQKVYALTLYFLVFPSAVLLWFGMRNYSQVDRRTEPFKKYFIILADIILFYGIFSGIIADKAGFWPANYLNTQSFLVIFKIPVEIFRAICAIGMLLSIIKILNMFEHEFTQRTDKYIEELNTMIFSYRRMEGALRDSESTYRLLVENINDGIYISDLDGKFVFVNQEMAKMFGYEKEEMPGMSIYSLSGLNAPIFKNMFLDMINLQDTGLAEIELERKNKQSFLAEIKFAKFTSERGEKRVCAIVRDVSTRKTARRQLEDAENKYKRLVDNLNVGIYRNTPGPQGNFLEANPAIIKMFGYESKDEFLRIHVSDLYQNIADRKKFSDKILSEGFVKYEELLLKKKDGTSIWGAVTAVVVRDENGDVKWLDGIIEDVSEHKKMEQALMESEEKLRLIAESSSDIILAHDINRNLYFMNPAFEKITGYSSFEAISQGYVTFVHAQDAYKILQIMEKLFVQKEPVANVEFRIITKLGQEKWCLGSWSVIYDKNNIYRGVLGVIRDITEIRGLNLQLEHKHRLAILGEAIAAASHELRNPLQVMTLNLDKIKPYTSVKGERYLRDIKSAIKQAVHIINDMLEFSRTQKIELKLHDINELIDSVIIEMQTMLKSKKIEVNANLDKTIKQVMLDHNKFKQVLVNLIDNSLESMPKGGSIDIKTRQLSMGDKLFLQLEISDNGTGIDMDSLEKIFTPFFTTKPDSTGLGLSVVQKIITLHGGRISVSSLPGAGTQFIIELPVI